MTSVSGNPPQAAPPGEEELELAETRPSEEPEPPRVVIPRWVQLV